LENNSLAVDRLQQNRDLWIKAGGCDPELLATPTEHHMDHVTKTVQTLNAMLDKYGPYGGLDSFVGEIQSAMKMLKIVSWEAIRADRFSLTPQGLYDDLVKSAQHLISNWGADYQRRQARMQAPIEEAPERKLTETPIPLGTQTTRPKDKYGLDIDGEFRTRLTRRYVGWENTLKAASEIAIDEMRTLLELHYEDVCVEKHENRQKRGSGVVIGSVAYAHRRKLNQRLVIPPRIKGILRSPKDETNVNKLNQLLQAIRAEIEGEREFHMTTTEQIHALAESIQSCTSRRFADEVALNISRLIRKSRLLKKNLLYFGP